MRQFLPCVTLSLGLALLAACGNGTAEFDRRNASYVGQPEVRLVEELGVPHRIYETEGRRFLEYEFSSAAAPASPAFSLGFGAGSFSGGRHGWGSGFGTGLGVGIPLGGSRYEPIPCIVTFEVRDGRVLDFRRQGEGCG
jgi:hypothetical protein